MFQACGDTASRLAGCGISRRRAGGLPGRARCRGSVRSTVVIHAKRGESLVDLAQVFVIGAHYVKEDDWAYSINVRLPVWRSVCAMRALIDETVPLVGGHHAYVVVATLLIETDAIVVEDSALSIIGERKKAFHWIDEGANVRQRAITCLIELGACAHVVVHHPTGRKRQQQAREAALRVAIPKALEDGATELMIESRGADLDVRDRVAVIGALSALERDDVHYSWHDKSRPEMSGSRMRPVGRWRRPDWR